LPSIVRVTNLDNGRSLIVRVNDRGPFVNGRIIDLSRKSAQLLGLETKGTARVRVQIMGEESRALASRLKSDNPGREPPIAAAAPREQVVAAESLAPPPGAKSAPAKPTNTPPKPPAITTDQRMEAAAQAAESQIGAVSQGKTYPTNIYVQAGTFAKKDNAQKLVTSLSSLGQVHIQQFFQKGQALFRVRVGPMATAEDADKVLDRVIAAGQQDARVVVD
jgi:rare lipoprotein A